MLKVVRQAIGRGFIFAAGAVFFLANNIEAQAQNYLSLTAQARTVNGECKNNEPGAIDESNVVLIEEPNDDGTWTGAASISVTSQQTGVSVAVDVSADLETHSASMSYSVENPATCGSSNLDAVSQARGIVQFGSEIHFFVDQDKYDVGDTVNIPVIISQSRDTDLSLSGSWQLTPNSATMSDGLTYEDARFQYYREGTNVFVDEYTLTFEVAENSLIAQPSSPIALFAGNPAASFSSFARISAYELGASAPANGNHEIQFEFGPLPDGLRCVSSGAAIGPCQKLEPKIAVVFVNGMNTADRDVRRQYNTFLRTFVEISPELRKSVTPFLNRNPHVGLFSDFEEVKLQSRFDELFEDLSDFKFRLARFQEQEAEIRTFFDDFYGSVVGLLNATNDQQRKHTEFYEERLDDGYFIVIVGYSQGNLYANLSYNSLVNYQNRIRILSIATPTSQVADGKNSYTTEKNDRIITYHAPRRLDVDVLPGNIQNESNLCSWFDYICSESHDFEDVYLGNDTKTRESILLQLATTLQELH